MTNRNHHTKTSPIPSHRRERQKGAAMPRMSKKRKEEWAFFLIERNRITYNPLCRKCRRTCKQSFRATIIECPAFISKRAKQPDGKGGGTYR
mgnify:CR=1 FL=1